MPAVVGASDRPVYMTPDKTVSWTSHQVTNDGFEGMLYLPPSATDAYQLLFREPKGPILGKGQQGGTTYLPPEDFPGIVIKEFRTSDISLRGWLPAIRANVMLFTGLDRSPQNNEVWRMRGVEVLGALTIYSSHAQERKPDNLTARWIMRRVIPDPALDDFYSKLDSSLEGISGTWLGTPNSPALPGFEDRVNRYKTALQEVGATVSQRSRIIVDDQERNRIIEVLPEVGEDGTILRQGVVTKIDTNAYSNFTF